MQAKHIIANKLENMIGRKFDNGSLIWCDETERLYIAMKDKVIGITPGKRDIVELKCKNCGSPLPVDGISSIVTCEHCKSIYDIDDFLKWHVFYSNL